MPSNICCILLFVVEGTAGPDCCIRIIAIVNIAAATILLVSLPQLDTPKSAQHRNLYYRGLNENNYQYYFLGVPYYNYDSIMGPKTLF